MGSRDTVIWIPLPSSRFVCISFRKSIARVETILKWWKGLWELLVPLKVNCSMWLVIRDRVAIRDGLQRLGLIQGEKNVCLICIEGKEKSSHLFVYCARVYRVWASVSQLWDTHFVEAGNVVTNFDVWF